MRLLPRQNEYRTPRESRGLNSGAYVVNFRLLYFFSASDNHMSCVRKQTINLVKLDRNADTRPSVPVEGEIWRERIFVDRETPIVRWGTPQPAFV